MNPAAIDNLISKYGKKLTPERQKIVHKLARLEWFAKTSPKLQEKLILLPQTGIENHDGFLEDLAARPESLGGVEILKLHSLSQGAFAVIPRFDVRSIDGGHKYTYEYVSWRQGPLSGAKGLVFVRPAKNQAPTHFVVVAGEKFATGSKVYDAIGGFIDLGVQDVQTIMDRILLEIKQEIGVLDMPVDEVIRLGDLHTDVGMTNNKPVLFLAFITTKNAARIPKDEFSLDIYELKVGASLLPLSELKQLCEESTNSYFFAALVKSLVSAKTPKSARDAILKTLTD